MAVEPTLARRDLRERHADLERDAGLLGEDDDRADRAHGGGDEVVELAHDRVAPGKVVLEVVQPAHVCVWLRFANTRSHFGQRQSGSSTALVTLTRSVERSSFGTIAAPNAWLGVTSALLTSFSHRLGAAELGDPLLDWAHVCDDSSPAPNGRRAGRCCARSII